MNQRMHSVSLKSQYYYNTPAASCCRSYWPINREHTIVQNSCL